MKGVQLAPSGHVHRCRFEPYHLIPGRNQASCREQTHTVVMQMPTAEKFRPTLDVASTLAHLVQGSLGREEG
jgi:hypothetical protein